jgi:tetratricopeptide (TPR) repeat protein
MTKLTDIISDVRRAKALRILIIDACRDNPMAERLDAPASGATRVASRSAGLAKISTRSMAGTATNDGPQNRGGDIVVYAAEAGRTASDGTGRNSPFSGALLHNIETEGQEIVSLMRRVTVAVQQETNGEQRPELSIAVPFEFYFKPGPPQPPPTIQQLLPNARPHEIGAIESEVEAIVARAPEAERIQVRRELMVLIADISERSGLKPDQIATELPRAHQRLVQMRRDIEEFRRLTESEPGIAPFVELAAAAVSSGRRQDMRAADDALAQARARYDEAIRLRTEGLERARANRAALSEQRGNIANTEYRSMDAARFYLAAAQDTPESDPENVGRRYASAAFALTMYGHNFFDNGALRRAVEILHRETLPRFEKIKTDTEQDKKVKDARIAIAMAELADARVALGLRVSGMEGFRHLADAQRIYDRALRRFRFDDFPAIAMNILDQRAQRDMEYGRRVKADRGRPEYQRALETRREILAYQLKHPEFRDDLGRSRNNLAYVLMELSRRVDGEEGDKLIDEAIGLLEESLQTLSRLADRFNVGIARTNLAYSLALRAERRAGMQGAADFDRARTIFEAVDGEINRDSHPRLWSTIRMWQAEFLRIAGKREPDDAKALATLRDSYRIFQSALVVISRETAPNIHAQVTAEMGYTLVAALPRLDDPERRRFAAQALELFDSVRGVFEDGWFYQDLEKLDNARQIASAAASRSPGDSLPQPVRPN